jgi:uncharacterized membrane protein
LRAFSAASGRSGSLGLDSFVISTCMTVPYRPSDHPASQILAKANPLLCRARRIGLGLCGALLTPVLHAFKIVASMRATGLKHGRQKNQFWMGR